MRVVSKSLEHNLETPGVSEALPVSSFPDEKKAAIDVLERTALVLKDKQEYRVLSVRLPVGGTNAKASAIVQIACDHTLNGDRLSLGLSITKGIIELHDGAINVESAGLGNARHTDVAWTAPIPRYWPHLKRLRPQPLVKASLSIKY